jgi:hypothetical protein
MVLWPICPENDDPSIDIVLEKPGGLFSTVEGLSVRLNVVSWDRGKVRAVLSLLI